MSEASPYQGKKSGGKKNSPFSYSDIRNSVKPPAHLLLDKMHTVQFHLFNVQCNDAKRQKKNRFPLNMYIYIFIKVRMLSTSKQVLGEFPVTIETILCQDIIT